MGRVIHQVFVSSTYSDLIEERKKIIEILLMADCIPAGMEAFVATDLDQFEVIKRVISLCDYYILIIGKRYGSVNPDTNLSYTEMEYDYAIEQGIPVLVFAIDDKVILSNEKTEQDEDKKRSLIGFRNRALTNRLASIWTSSDDLVTMVAISIMKAKSEFVRPGWQKATDYDEASLRRDIMSLMERNETLSSELAEAKKTVESLLENKDLAFDDCMIEIVYYLPEPPLGIVFYNEESKTTESLRVIFNCIAVEMLDSNIDADTTETLIKKYIIKCINCELSDNQLVKRILLQLSELGLITSTRTKNGYIFWTLTQRGIMERNRHMLIRTAQDVD